MYSILGLTLQELSLKTNNDQRFGLTEEQKENHRAEAVRFGESVIGRELLHYLPVHQCNRGCDSLELSIAEEFAAKRPRNTQGLSIFVKRFNFNIRRADGEMLRVMNENNWSTMQYLEAWLNEFLLRGIDVLHGDLAPEELLGDGYAFETWERFSGFLASVNGPKEPSTEG